MAKSSAKKILIKFESLKASSTSKVGIKKAALTWPLSRREASVKTFTASGAVVSYNSWKRKLLRDGLFSEIKSLANPRGSGEGVGGRDKKLLKRSKPSDLRDVIMSKQAGLLRGFQFVLPETNSAI